MFPVSISKKPFLALLVVAAVMLSATLVFAQFVETDAKPASSPQTQRDYVVVTFQDPPAASYAGGIPGYAATKPQRGKKLKVADPAVQNYLRRLNQGHANFRSFLANSAPRAQLVREFFLVQNAVAVKLNGNSPNTLASAPGVKSVEFSALYRPTMDVSVELIKATSLWPSAGGQASAGTGIKVGVIDSGIDDKHPFFVCKSSITHKVYTSGVAGNPNKLLVNTHGTHVAGTIGGCLITLPGALGTPVSGPISGIVPAAELHDYNVFPGFGAGFIAFGGSAFSHDIAHALEDTVNDGMDAVNISIGGGVQGPHDSLAEAVNAAVDAGLVVAVAAGNSGPGSFTIESPGSAANALTAGAITNPHFIGVPVSKSGGGTFGAVVGDFGLLSSPITADYTATTPPNGCTAISENLTGKIGLIVRGTCSFSAKISNAQAKGAIAVIMVQNIIGDPIIMGQDGTPNQPTIPAVMVNKDAGPDLGGSGNATIGTTLQEFITTNGDIIASLSSNGPTPFTYLIKPDVTAPGVNVYSSVFGADPDTDFGFEMFQGTSMATPHLTGSAALLLQLHPGWSPADVKSALVNTAKRPVLNATATGSPPAGLLARGGGRIDLEKANATPLTIDPVSASFGLFRGNAVVSGTLDLNISNVSGSAQSCSVSVTGVPIVSTASSIAVAGGSSTTLTLALNGGRSGTTPSGFYGGDVVLTCGSDVLKAPWLVVIDRLAIP